MLMDDAENTSATAIAERSRDRALEFALQRVLDPLLDHVMVDFSANDFPVEDSNFTLKWSRGLRGDQDPRAQLVELLKQNPEVLLAALGPDFVVLSREIWRMSARGHIDNATMDFIEVRSSDILVALARNLRTYGNAETRT
jgi:hypothetical protein